MDRLSHQPQHKRGDLRHSRSRDNKHQSSSSSSSSSFNQTTQARFEGLNLNIAAAINAQAASHLDNIPSSVPSLSTNPSSESNSPAFLTCPVSTFPSHGSLLQDWSYLDSCLEADDPLLRFAQQVPTSGPANITTSPPPTGIFTPEEMSTLGIQFDPSFDASIRPSYSWPAAFDMNDQFTHQDNTMNSFHIPTTSSSNMPSFSRSYSSSPPQAMFTPEQRELKRQRDLARRESKTRMRRDRSASNSYTTSQNSTPDLLPRTIASNANSYSSAIIPSLPAVAASSPSFASPGFMPQMSASESPELYGAPFSMIANDYNMNNYIVPFSSAEQSLSAYTLPTQGRPHSLSTSSEPSSNYYRSAALSSLPSHQHTSPHLISHQHSHSTSHTHLQQALTSSGEPVRVVHSRPKPQCWEHGCAGRQFSTFSNLLRHQREKSGVASKPTCPKCGAEFTRTTARNGHMAHEKCKGRRNS